MNNKLPGCEWMPICYADNEVFIRRAYEGVHVYRNVEYKTPLKGVMTKGWLSCGCWSIVNGKYYQRNGLGGATGIVVNTLEEIAEVIKNSWR